MVNRKKAARVIESLGLLRAARISAAASTPKINPSTMGDIQTIEGSTWIRRPQFAQLIRWKKSKIRPSTVPISSANHTTSTSSGRRLQTVETPADIVPRGIDCERARELRIPRALLFLVLAPVPGRPKFVANFSHGDQQLVPEHEHHSDSSSQAGSESHYLIRATIKSH